MPFLRNINGLDLVKKLSFYGYYVSRQTGSHIRITTNKNGEHHETIPAHKPLKIGTLSKILKNISKHQQISVEELNREIGL